MRPFGCPVTILNTINILGKFDGKADEGSGPDWLFDIDALTRTMNYKPILAGTQSNGFAGTKASDNAGQARKETEPIKDYILLPLWTVDPPFSQDLKSSHNDGSKPLSDDGNKVDKYPSKESECNDQDKEDNVNSTNNVNTIEEEMYVCQPPGFKDPYFPAKVYKVEKALYRLHHAPRAWFTEVKTASTPMETHQPLLKDVDGEKVDVHMYRYLKGQPKLGLWYPKDSPFNLVAYTNSDYARASLDRKFTTRGCQFLRCRLISWQCKKLTVVLNSTTEAEYNTKTTKRNEIASLKRRVKKLKKKNRSRTHRLKRLYKVGLTARVESSGDKESLGEDASKQGRIDDIDTDKDITLVSVQDDADKEMFNVNVLDGEEAFVVGIKTSKPKVKRIVIQEPGKSTTTTTIISSQQSQDKGKGIMIEEPVKPKKKDQIRLDEEAAKKLQAEFDEEERLAREKTKKEQRANIALIEE
uniref:Reverse transcriptase Ty1/copia-type domain-containing protein n=1 Tax=Tanacetum cinerariifolium TaxID=118510 RepID=A0A6L2LBX8_TANCI|nr:hypothetical protein [Tanacetum cinerariifolium]